MRFIVYKPVAVAAVALSLSVSTFAQAPATRPLVSPIFGDNMVLQRGKPNTIWGWAQPGDAVRVEIGPNSATGTAGADGKWSAKIEPPPAGGPYTVRITGRESLELHDVLVGDVWICAGQSNMQFGLGQARNGAEEVKNADFPQIRYFVVGQRVAYSPVDVPRGNWRAVTPATVGGRGGGLSAIAYFFGRKLYQNVHVPIGLVQDAVGGVPAETFTTPEGLRPLKDFDPAIVEVERRLKAGGPQYGNYITHWYDDYDKGTRGGANWADPGMDDSSWKSLPVPGGFAAVGLDGVPGLVWLRKEITLPDPVPQGAARLYLGSVDKMDTAYINGKQVGRSSWVENPRVYFANGVLKPGRNVIAIRLFKLGSSRGFLGKADEVHLTLGDGSLVPLSGDWKAKVSVDGHPPQALPIFFENNPTMPGVLYNGMLAPVVPLSITGALWYQGESNERRPEQYHRLLPAMIADWRRVFGQGDFPFYIVSLPGYHKRSDVPTDDAWTGVRDAQIQTAATVAHSCAAITLDTGDPDNVHAIDKKDPGERAALCALGDYYGQKVVYQGPTFTSTERTGAAVKVHFTHTDGGLVAKGTSPQEFAVAGNDRKWYWADARIDGDTVIVSSSSVPNPVAVRYAWQAYPAVNLYNGAGLPAVPFRTDAWPVVTEIRQQ